MPYRRQVELNAEGAPIPGDTGPEVIGNRLREIREAFRKSRAEVAQATGLDLALLEAVENGTKEPTVSMMSKIAESLEVPLGELLGNLSPRALVVATQFAKAPAALQSALMTLVKHPWVKA